MIAASFVIATICSTSVVIVAAYDSRLATNTRVTTFGVAGTF
jgi:hypothetical protein